ncbi:MAG: Diaminohydroxyphosphoribosylaminopyrimidine deaminase [Pseudomonadota bacterium]|jgi:diaminohydroxyphosphoribosylaminopyrimidine deaminase/5-amino-6-(5-phosphoribosylamino)uracil reductase
MAAAIALSGRTQALTAPNPNVGCIVTQAGCIVGRGWTQPGGRPHAEAMALDQAGEAARGATAYVTLEPCAHESPRGPTCVDSLIAAGVSRVVIALTDPDPRTNGQGIARLQAAGIDVAAGLLADDARRAMAGWLMQHHASRPFITLKLATSLDGCIALASGESKWITGDAARAHGHLERARTNMILVGGETGRADAPRLNVRLPGLEARSPARALLTRGAAAPGWMALSAPDQVHGLAGVHYLLVEGGAQTAAAFLKAGLVDRLLLYRAPILIGGGRACLGDIGLGRLADAQGQWQLADSRLLGKDQLDVYERV